MPSIKDAFLIFMSRTEEKRRAKAFFKKQEYLCRENEGRRRFFLVGTPEHGNLGDHLIALAETEYLHDYFHEALVLEVPKNIFANTMRVYRKLIQTSPILITGGGNMGTLWYHHEVFFRKIVRLYPDNRIFFFPQTIYYENSAWGKGEFEESKKIYGAHGDLHICAREKKSFALMKEAYPQNNILLAPDIATYLKKDLPAGERREILLCLREDKEAVLRAETREEIFKEAGRFDMPVRRTGTVLEHAVGMEERNRYLEEKLDEFRRASLVITDRLHGMLFAAITGTPCIALNNASKKVEGVFEWIKNNEYIRFVAEPGEIPGQIEILLKMQACRYNKNPLHSCFDLMASILI